MMPPSKIKPLIETSSPLKPPFAVLAAIPLKKRQAAILIAPTEVLTRRDVPAWKLRYTTGPIWKRVVEATPMVR